MEDVVELEMLCNSYLLLGPGLRTLAFPKSGLLRLALIRPIPKTELWMVWLDVDLLGMG